MIVNRHFIAMQAEHQFEQQHSVKERIMTRHERDESTLLTQQNSPLQSGDAQNGSGKPEVLNTNSGGIMQSEDTRQLDASTYHLKLLVEHFTGKAISLKTIEPQDSGAARSLRQTQTETLIYQKEETFHEFEASSFEATGKIELKDGRTVTFNFSALAQRDFFTHETLDVQMGEVTVIDPLVLNLNDSPLSLSNQKVMFDLNNDGEDDSIYFATGNSGFLAIDRNNNGRIDNGSEVIGALSGDGFGELQAFDIDNNRFIDQGDTVFERLLFYQKDEYGQDQLRPLSSIGVGALYVGSTLSPFTVKDNENEAKAIVRSSGVFLYQDATIGQLQQIDLVI